MDNVHPLSSATPSSTSASPGTTHLTNSSILLSYPSPFDFRPSGWLYLPMDEILPAESDGPDATPIKVPFLRFRRDAGTAWARTLNQGQIADLIDLAGNLGDVVPILAERRVTEKQFMTKLRGMGLDDEAKSRLSRVVGFAGSGVSLYYIWWSWAWVYNYTRATSMSERSEEESREVTAKRMGLTPVQLEERLARRDVSFMVNLFLSRAAREMQGEIAWRTTQQALEGGVKAQDLYYKHVATNEELGDKGGLEFDPFNMPSDEMQESVKKMRKQLNLHQSQDAEIEIIQRPKDE